MCGRFTLTDPSFDLVVQFDLPDLPEMPPRYNIAPTQPVAAVRLAKEGANRELAMLHWGLIPSWAKDAKIGARMINARSETVAEKPSFRSAFRKRRCLVLADGFYEWQKQDGGKQPFYIRLQSGQPFAFAGLWEYWTGPEDLAIQSCTLLTTQPNDLLRDLHNRMPVILHPRDYDLWLDREVQEPELLQPLLRAFPPELMEAYAVSRYVNKPGNDDERCIEPVSTGEDRRLPGI